MSVCEQKADLTGLRDGGNKDILNEKHKPTTVVQKVHNVSVML